MAKPIFIIMLPEDTPRDSIVRSKDIINTQTDLSKDYHIFYALASVSTIEFKLLNGTQENYDSLDEIKAKILEIV